VALLVTVTDAFGTAPPEESRTLPSMAPRSTCPNAGTAQIATNASNNTDQSRNVRVPIPRFIAASTFQIRRAVPQLSTPFGKALRQPSPVENDGAYFQIASSRKGQARKANAIQLPEISPG